MKFSKLENIMMSKGVNTLADIARVLDSTPQAVSNWKARDRVPSYVVNNLNEKFNNVDSFSSQVGNINAAQNINLSDIIIIMAQQFKVLTVIPFITIFLSFTYTQFITIPIFESSSKILIPDQQQSGGNFGGIASQFGIQMGSNIEKDLSSPSLYPDLVKSRMFAERMLKKSFYSESFKKDLTLFSILNNMSKDDTVLTNLNLDRAIRKFHSNIIFDSKSGLSTLRIRAEDPKLAQEINSTILTELQELSRFYKSKKVKEKLTFISNRITQVENDLEKSEQDLKIFRQKNQQIVSPALMLELEQLTRESEVQKGVFLTLKQQLELAKIEEIQETSIMQILDYPNIPVSPINKNLKLSLVLGLLFGSLLAVSISFVRAYFDRDDQTHKRKIRKGKNYLRKKLKDLFSDRRVTGLIGTVLLLFSPFYFGYKSQAPIFFGMYSLKLLLINSVYFIFLLTIVILFIKAKKDKNSTF